MAANLLMSDENSDVILKVRHEGFSWRMPAHSLFLLTQSSTFREMLEERAEDDQPTPLTLTGVNPETVVAMLKHIYNEEYPTDITADLYLASQKYNLTSLRDYVEKKFISDMTIVQACRMLEELEQRQPAKAKCSIKAACQKMIEKHALTVFGSDLVHTFSKRTLIELLQSNTLNIPDEAYVFWGLWRWGRRECSKLARPLTDQTIATYIDDLIVHVRCSDKLTKKGIPAFVFSRFDHCKRRDMYCSPSKVLKHTSTLRLAPSWDDVLPIKTTDDSISILCCQLSFEKDVLLFGMTFEIYSNEQFPEIELDSFLSIIREKDSTELRRQKLCWCRTQVRRTSVKSELEYHFESKLMLHEPVFLTPGHIYSVYLRGNFSMCSLLWGSIKQRRGRLNNTYVNLHGDGVTAVREAYMMPDLSLTWGTRGLEF